MGLEVNFPLQEFIENFEFEGIYRDHQAFGDGHIHDTFKLIFEQENTSNTYLLQKMNTTVFQKPLAVMQNIQRVSEHLSKKYQLVSDGHRRYLNLVPLKNRQAFYQDRQGQYWRAYDFIQDTFSPNFVETPAQAYEAAHAFATFVRDLIDCKVEMFQETIPNFHHLGLRFESFEESAENADSERVSVSEKTIEMAKSKKYLLNEVTKVLTQIPLRVVHNDTKINNVLLDKQTGKGLCVVDLDTVMPGYLLYDFGDLVRTSLSPVAEDHPDLETIEIRLPIFKAIVKGYLEVWRDVIHPLEKKYLFLGAKLMTYIMAIRFLTDYLDGDVYYKIIHPLHNLDRAKNQLHLLGLLEEQEEILQNEIKSFN